MKAFLFYIDDWLGSTKIAAMTAEEERGYLRLLLHAAKSEDCGLPNDPAALAALALFTPAKWKKSSPRLLDAFFEKDGRLYNARMLKVFEEWKARQSRRSEAGKKGNEQRWAASQRDRNAIANAHGSESQNGRKTIASYSYSHALGTTEEKTMSPDGDFCLTEPEKVPAPKAPVRFEYPAAFEAVWRAYWNDVGKKRDAFAAWKKTTAAIAKGQRKTQADAEAWLLGQVEKHAGWVAQGIAQIGWDAMHCSSYLNAPEYWGRNVPPPQRAAATTKASYSEELAKRL